MSVLRWITVLSCAALIVSCVTPESSARFARLTPEDTVEIATALRKLTSAPILEYYRREDGTIDVSTDGDGLYSARKVRGKWKLKKKITVT
jgi:hypothetical protein